MHSKVMLSSIMISLMTGSVSFAAVTGQIRDTNRAAVSGAVVTFTSESDGTNQYAAITDENGYYAIDFQPTAVHNPVPESFSLGQNYPNPFNPTTTIPFTLEQSGMVELTVYNVLGQKVRTLVAGHLSAGSHTVIWNCLDDTGRNVGAGIYLYQLQSGGMSRTHKMLLLDGGASGLSATAKPAVSFSAGKPAGTTFRVNITGENIADFEDTGLTLSDGQVQSFTVFPNDGMLLASVVGDMLYTDTLAGLDVGSTTNSNAIETTQLVGISRYGDMVFISEGYMDNIHRYDRTADGGLEYADTLTMPAGSIPGHMAFVDSHKAYVSLTGLGKLIIIDPMTMTKTGEIDLTTYAVGDDDFNPEPAHMLIRDGKLFVLLGQAKSMYIANPAAYILIVDVATDTVGKMISDERTCQGMVHGDEEFMFIDDNGDIYVFGIAAWGYQEGVTSGFLRINNNETEFDPDFFFSMDDLYIPDVPGNKGAYIQNMIYAGGSELYGFLSVPGLQSDPPDYVNDRNFPFFKFDLATRTAERIGSGTTNGWAHGVCGYDNLVVFSMSSATGNGLFTYDPRTGEVSDAPVVTTEGMPLYLLSF